MCEKRCGRPTRVILTFCEFCIPRGRLGCLHRSRVETLILAVTRPASLSPLCLPESVILSCWRLSCRPDPTRWQHLPRRGRTTMGRIRYGYRLQPLNRPHKLSAPPSTAATARQPNLTASHTLTTRIARFRWQRPGRQDRQRPISSTRLPLLP